MGDLGMGRLSAPVQSIAKLPSKVGERENSGCACDDTGENLNIHDVSPYLWA
jgi:hypothetical protein